MNVTDRDLSHYLTWDVSGAALCALARLRFVDGTPDDAGRLLAPRDEVRVGLYFSSGTECFALFLPPVGLEQCDVLREFAGKLLRTRPELVDEALERGAEGASVAELWAPETPEHIPYTLTCVCNPSSMPGLTAHVLGELGEHSAVSVYPATPAPASSVAARFTFRLLELDAVRTLVGSLYRTAAALQSELPPAALDFHPPEDYTP